MKLARASRLLLLAFAVLALMTYILYSAVAFALETWGPKALVIRVEGTIDEGVVGYIREALDKAREMHAPLIIYLDTPGGYLESALKIVDMFDESSVPVIVYAGGRWAVSAGTLILVSAPLAYASPRTVIGSMQPVMLTPEGVRPVNESKIINTLLKILEVHCKAYGRNFTIVSKFVTKNLNLDGEEALRYHVVDGIAMSIGELITKVNGSRVKLFNGTIVLLELDGSIYEFEMPLRYRIVSILSDPTLSSLLLSLGSLIVIVSLASGHLAYASIGLLLILLGLFGLGYNVNLVALLLILLGSLLLAIDLAIIPGFGVVGSTGAVMLVLGLVLLPYGSSILVSRSVLEDLVYTAIGIGAFFGVLSAFIAYKVAGAKRRPPLLRPTPVGKIGKALDEITPDREGFVLVDGEYWRAVSASSVIKPGEPVRVVGKEGPLLIVEKVEGRPGKFSSSAPPRSGSNSSPPRKA